MQHRITVQSETPRYKSPFFKGEKWLTLTGLLGFLLAGVCGIYTLIYGGERLPEGDVLSAFSFNAALGIFMLSTAAIAPLSGLGTKGRAVFRWSYIALALYAYAAETVQNFRGVDPRFTTNGSSFDEAVGSIFGLVAVLLILFYVYMGLQFFRKKVYRQNPTMTLSIRYAMVAIVVSFAAGIWISVNLGRYTGGDGNIIWLHGLGFHALQALPIVAWLAERTSLKAQARQGLVHIASIAFLLSLVAIGWQTMNGEPIVQWSILPIAAVLCLAVSLAAGAAALQQAVAASSSSNQYNQLG